MFRVVGRAISCAVRAPMPRLEASSNPFLRRSPLVIPSSSQPRSLKDRKIEPVLSPAPNSDKSEPDFSGFNFPNPGEPHYDEWVKEMNRATRELDQVNERIKKSPSK